MRTAIAVLIIAVIGLASYTVVVNYQNPDYKSVRLEGKKLVISGYENPEVKISGCGVEMTASGSIVDVTLKCSKIKVEVYSGGKLVFSDVFVLAP